MAPAVQAYPVTQMAPVQAVQLPPLQPVSISVPAQNLARNADGSGTTDNISISNKKSVSFDEAKPQGNKGEGKEKTKTLLFNFDKDDKNKDKN